MADKKHRQANVKEVALIKQFLDDKSPSAKDQLIEMQTQRALDANKRVDRPGGSTRVDSAMASYPVSVLSKPQKMYQHALDRLIEMQTQRELDANKRVDRPGGSTRVDSAMAGYPVSVLSKPQEGNSNLVLNLLRQRDYTLANIESGSATRVDSTVLQYLDEEIMNALGKKYKKSPPKAKAEPLTREQEKTLVHHKEEYGDKHEQIMRQKMAEGMTLEESHRAAGKQLGQEGKHKSTKETPAKAKISLPWSWMSTMRRAKSSGDVTEYLRKKGYSDVEIKEAIRRDQGE